MSCLHKKLTNFINDDRFANKQVKIRAPPKAVVAKS